MRVAVRLLFFFIIISTVSCKTADQQVPEIASDFCNCISPMEKEMSKKTLNIFSTAAAASDPEASLKSQIQALPDEDQMSVSAEIMVLSRLDDEKSDVGRCIKSVEKKYDKAYTFNEKKFIKKVIKELEAKSGCSFTAAIMTLGMKIQEE